MKVKIDLVTAAWIVAALFWVYGLALVGFEFVYLCFGFTIGTALYIEMSKE